MSRVLVLGSYAPSLELFRLPMLREMVARGHEVLAATPPEPGYDINAILNPMGVKHIEVSFSRNRTTPFEDLLLIRRLKRLMCDLEVDVLLAYSIKPNVFGSLAAPKGVRVGVMITGLGRALLGRGLTSRASRALLRRACQRSTHVFVQNPDDLSTLHQLGVVTQDIDSTILAGSGVDIQEFAPTGLPEQPVVLMLARLLHSKGVSDYLAASALIRSECPEIRCRLAGMFDVGKDAMTKSEINDAVQSGDIEYLGHFTDTELVKQAIREASIYCLPSWHEGTPHSSLEAMAMGRPVVTTDVRGCRETVIDGHNGILVPSKNPRALADAIIALGSSPDRRQAMGLKSRRMAEDKFDTRLVANDICDSMDL